ncbi:MAG: DNA polymerase [Solirubrobacteraceae bacterium]
MNRGLLSRGRWGSRVNAVAFDTETKGFAWWTPAEQAFLVTWATADGEWWADLGDPESPGVCHFLDAIQAADVIIGHNLKFDIHQVRATIGFDIADYALRAGKRLEDTDLMSRVLYPEGQNKGARGGHGLKNLATVYLRVDAKDPEEAIKEMGKRIGLRTIKQVGAYYDVYRAYPGEMRAYALADARYTRDLYDKFLHKASEEPRQADIYEMERQLMPIIIEAERVGIRTDQDKVAHFKQKFTAQHREYYGRLTSELGEAAFGGEGSEEALVEALLKHGIPLHERTKEIGKLSTSKFALQEFEYDFPVIADLFEYRRLERFLNTYIGPMDGVEVIHPNFGQIGAWTGRMSCRQPNMQNWPKLAGKEVRSVLVPREGYCFIATDYEGIEERLLAYYLGDPGYRELASHYDPHAWLAAQIWGGEPELYMKGTDKAISHRQPAKKIKYAIAYGAGKPRVRALLREAGLPATEDDARRIISKVKSALPNYYYLTKHRIEPKVKRYGYVNTIAGRKNPINKNKAYVGLSGLIQGSAADIMKMGAIGVSRAVSPFGAYPLLFVHDEVLTECPLGRELECQAAQDAAMLAAWDLNPPLAVESSIAYHDYSEA